MNTFVERNPSGQKHLDEAKEYKLDPNGGPDILLSRYFVDKNNLYQGLFERYNERGEVVEQGHYKNGKKDGVWTSRYPFGGIEEECPYQNGKRHGVCKRYFSRLAGQEVLAEEITYREGEIWGPYREFDLKQNVTKAGFRRANGRYGIWAWYDEEGRVVKKCCYDNWPHKTVIQDGPLQNNGKNVPFRMKKRLKTLTSLKIIAGLAPVVWGKTVQRARVAQRHADANGLTPTQVWQAREGVFVHF